MIHIILYNNNTMKIIIDNREHLLYEKCSNLIQKNPDKYKSIKLIKTTLILGDVVITDDSDNTIIIIERKTFSDLLASIRDGRYNEQSHRLKHASNVHTHNIIYLLEGMFSQVSEDDKKKIYSCMTSIQLFKGFSVIRCSAVEETAELIVNYAEKIDRSMKANTPLCFTNNSISPTENLVCEITDTVITQDKYSKFVKKVKKENITPENIGEIMLCQIPDVSTQAASTVMNEYKTLGNLISALKENPTCIDQMSCADKNGKMRKIKKNSLDNIKHYLQGAICNTGYENL